MVDLKPAVTALPTSTAMATVVGTGGCYTGYLGGWVLGEGYYPPTLPPRPQDWYCQGPTHSPHRCLRPPGHFRVPPGPLRTPRLPALRYALPEPIRARFRVIYLKVRSNPECRRNSVMRPAILPISRTGSNVTTLNFQVFRYGQPSLTRNKWSRLGLNHG